MCWLEFQTAFFFPWEFTWKTSMFCKMLSVKCHYAFPIRFIMILCHISLNKWAVSAKLWTLQALISSLLFLLNCLIKLYFPYWYPYFIIFHKYTVIYYIFVLFVKASFILSMGIAVTTHSFLFHLCSLTASIINIIYLYMLFLLSGLSGVRRISHPHDHPDGGSWWQDWAGVWGSSPGCPQRDSRPAWLWPSVRQSRAGIYVRGQGTVANINLIAYGIFFTLSTDAILDPCI